MTDTSRTPRGLAGAGTENDAASRIMVALDYGSASEAEALLSALKGIPCYMKVGMQLYFAEGPSFVERLKRDGYRVFVDLKMHDIPNTVKGGARSLAVVGADMINVHAAGGKKMMEAALEGAASANSAGHERPLVIAVTQLTSTDAVTMNEEIGIPGSVEDAVIRYARLAKEAGLDGVVSSPWEAAKVKEACGASFVTVTPGIRPAGTSVDDQARIMTPAQALGGGSDYMVIGRPITAQPDPRAAMAQILKELNHL
ncbi:orotidine-5'-phosphate decarboxylase [Xylanibacillus composti]|uniref:Orotidine 5'-phosphate decarboxylase n=1 Tax=Xylanibacillus composti TaxID=1572762 RepID=A0A8J4H3C0_9BACL|nr:orotidine-5'-phosphate decarboxylase [Xylanibacillus composti]MDT9724337.1 orotidine-5'-phosphate decarboxylase [Xylanibacillus composti]GIQ67928.1 orotidine 5'-phosphate decarboxylase [Xylanibacillus composti]